jgi:hypothetical protein
MVISIDTSKVGRISTIRPSHSRRVAFGAVSETVVEIDADM